MATQIKEAINTKLKFKLDLKGAPNDQLTELPLPDEIVLNPSVIPNIKPKLLVKEGESVKIGDVLFHDKKHPELTFRSPASGSVSKISFGHRRALIELRIKTDAQQYSLFEKQSVSKLSRKGSDKIRQALIERGLWSFFRALPFNTIPEPNQDIPAIFVSLDDDEPFKPQSSVFLKGNEDVFRSGVALLKSLTGRVIVASSESNQVDGVQDLIDLKVKGEYPSNQVDSIIYKTKQDASMNQSFYVHPQDLIAMVRCIESGEFPTQRIIAVSGAKSSLKTHIKCQIGAPLKSLNDLGINDDQTRIILGGVFKGRHVSSDEGVSLYDRSVTLIQEKDQSEFISFVQPGFNKVSYSKAFLSAILPQKPFEPTAMIQGSFRDCVACGYCADVCVVDALPQYLLRELDGNDVEVAMKHGLLDCTACGLCTHVCPSKIELADTFVAAKNNLLKELER